MVKLNKKYYIILGTKAELIKMVPIFLEFDKRKIDYCFIHTGQHDFGELLKTFKIRTPDIILNQTNGFSGNTGGALSWAIQTFKELYSILKKERGQFIIYHGDTQSTAIAAGVALLTGNRGVHVEAGLRSGNLREPFPEEGVRRIVDLISNVCFTPSEKCSARLKYKQNVFNVGNTVYDTIKCLNLDKKYKKPKKQYAVCTIHRHENIKSRERMIKILNILDKCPIEVRWYMHENTRKKLEEYDLLQTIKNNNIIIIPEKLDYFSFIPEFAKSSLIITDGGGMSDEAAYFKVPALLLRMNTEREELINSSCQILSELSVEDVEMWMKFLLASYETDFENNPYYKENSSKLIIDILEGLKK